jgi:hypothetical protein
MVSFINGDVALAEYIQHSPEIGRMDDRMRVADVTVTSWGSTRRGLVRTMLNKWVGQRSSRNPSIACGPQPTAAVWRVYMLPPNCVDVRAMLDEVCASLDSVIYYSRAQWRDALLVPVHHITLA